VQFTAEERTSQEVAEAFRSKAAINTFERERLPGRQQYLTEALGLLPISETFY
jgi:hypothetical protein